MNRDQYELKKRRIGDNRASALPPSASVATARPAVESPGGAKVASERPMPGITGGGGHK